MDHGARRPAGITALVVFSFVAAAIALTAAVSLAFPDGALEPIWRVNPRAREVFGRIGFAAVALMIVLSVACVVTGEGLRRGARWGYVLAIAGLAFQMLGDVVNTVFGIEPRAVIGIPIAGALILYLTTGRVRRFFAPRRVSP